MFKGDSRGFQGYTGFTENFSQFWGDSRGFTEVYKALQRVLSSLRRFKGFTVFYRGLQDLTGFTESFDQFHRVSIISLGKN